jgi:hypothetical protein
VYLVRDVFHCRPGRARELADKFRATIPSMEREDGFGNVRVMVDAAGPYWTVVLEAEFERMAQFEHHAATFGGRPEVRAALAGYMELVVGGYREVYRIVD